MKTINKNYVHKVAKELNMTVNDMRDNYKGFAMICGFDSVDEYLFDDMRRGFNHVQSADILRHGL